MFPQRFNAETPDSGEIFMDGKALNIKNASQAIANNIGYMTEDRKMQGLYLNFTLESNFVSNRLKDFSKQGFLQPAAMQKNAQKNVEDFNVVTPGIYQLLRNLSGGNQQKVLLGMWFGINPKLLIVDEPTRGVDIGAKSEIYSLLRELAYEGIPIMMISSDLPEILGVSDRVVVMKDGSVAGELKKEEITEDAVISLMAGTGEN